MDSLKKEALKYHQEFPSGKIETIPTKKCDNAEDLSLAYSPGVAYPCAEISKNPSKAYDYTSKGNLVAVVSNGTAVLGLGNIGPLASKPVMEGKAILFKKFADVNAFDIEIKENDVNKFCDIVASLEPTFGGINLEDIKAPECFEIEQNLIERMNIPVFHDDQHGTAIITVAALINALHIAEKDLTKVKIVISGAGAAAIAIANLLLEYNAKRENIFMFDSKGLITSNREVNEYKAKFSQKTDNTLLEAMTNADVFIGVSKGGLLNEKHIISMNKKPIIFAMANPIPEIFPDEAKKISPDAIVATGRSDFPNQVNNVLCFPFMFKGALEARAKKITSKMKKAAVEALANLAREPVPSSVEKIYGLSFTFGPEYIIPKPFDPRLNKVADAVKKAC